MEDAIGSYSRKQDRKYGLLGWWVIPILILPIQQGCWFWGVQTAAAAEGGEQAVASVPLQSVITPGLKAREPECRDGVCTPSVCPQGSHPALKGEVSLCSITRPKIPLRWGVNSLTGAPDARSAPVSPPRRIHKIDRAKVDPQILKAAQGMETMFLDYMMKVMRQTVPKNEMDMESPATEIYRGMLDSQYAEKAAKQGGVGLSDQIVAYLEERRYNLYRGQGIPPTPLRTKEKP